MSEFKGTKGNLKIVRRNQVMSIDNKTVADFENDLLPVEETIYNAILFKHSYEILEMLNMILKEYDLSIVTGIDALKVRELIKKATEL